MDIGIFSPNYSGRDATTTSFFIDGLSSGFAHLGVKVSVYSADDAQTNHWYKLSEDYKNLDCLLLPIDNGEQVGICRHVARLFPSLPVLLTGNFFSAVYQELKELSTAKILKRKVSAENSGRARLVESLADIFERGWNPAIYERALIIRTDLIGDGGEPQFVPVGLSAGLPGEGELAFPVIVQQRELRDTVKPVVIVDSPQLAGYYLETIESIATSQSIRIVIVDRSLRWRSAGSEGVIGDRADLLRICSAASLTLSVSPVPGYSAASIGALSLGIPLAAPCSSSYGDLLDSTLNLSSGFDFGRSVSALFDTLLNRPESLERSATNQGERLEQYFNPVIIAKQVVDFVKDQKFFIREKNERFRLDVEAAKATMLGEAIE